MMELSSRSIFSRLGSSAAQFIAVLFLVGCGQEDIASFRHEARVLMGLERAGATTQHRDEKDRNLQSLRGRLAEDGGEAKEDKKSGLDIANVDQPPKDQLAKIGTDGKNQKPDQLESPKNNIITCPPGTKFAGAAPPAGSAVWCEKGGGLFLSAIKNGPYINWYPNGNKKQQGAFSNGKFDGSISSWAEDGTLIEQRTYRKGQLNGPLVQYSRTGSKLREEHYLEGKRDGLFRSYNKNGTPLMEGYLRNNLKEGTWIIFSKDSQPKSKISYRLGKKEGRAELYFPSGLPSAQGAYHNGQPNGAWITFQRNGQKKAQGSYNNGIRTGTWTYFRPNGQTAKVVAFKNGEAQSTERSGERILSAESARKRAAAKAAKETLDQSASGEWKRL